MVDMASGKIVTTGAQPPVQQPVTDSAITTTGTSAPLPSFPPVTGSRIVTSGTFVPPTVPASATPVVEQPFLVATGALLEGPVVQFPNAGDRYASTNIAFSTEVPGTVRVRLRFTSVPDLGAFKWLVGFSAAGSGWLLTTEDTMSGLLDVGQVNFYASTDTVLRVVGRKVILSEQLNTILTFHLLFDGAHVRWFLDGHEIGKGQVNAAFGQPYTAYDLPFVALGIGSRGVDGLYTTPQQIAEVAITPRIMTQAEILVDAGAQLGQPMLEELHHYMPAINLGATWVDDHRTANLTRTGSPTLPIIPYNILSVKRTFQAWGDSITAGRQVDTTLGDGWRRRVQKNCCAAGKGITFVGAAPPGGSVNKDYDFWHDGHPSESLTTRLGTFATDMTYAGPDTGVILAYGVNDIAALNRTAAQLQTDIQSACAIIEAARPGVPIVLVNVLPVATGGATTGQHSQISAFQNDFGALVVLLRKLGHNVAGADVSSVVTDPNDVAQLYDGVHPTPTIYDAMGVVIANAVMTVL